MDYIHTIYIIKKLIVCGNCNHHRVFTFGGAAPPFASSFVSYTDFACIKEKSSSSII